MDVEEMVQVLQESGKAFDIVIGRAGILAYNTSSEGVPLFGWNWDDEFWSVRGKTLKEVLQQCLEKI